MKVRIYIILAVDSRWPPPWGLPSKGTVRQKTPNLARVQEPYRFPPSCRQVDEICHARER